MLICAACSQDKYGSHLAAPPHAANPASSPCAGYAPKNPCGNCGQDCELHDIRAPHGAEDFDCPAAVPPEGFLGGGGSFGGGGATGGW